MLRYVLWANCFSCAVFGAIFLVAAPASAQFIGSAPEWIMRALGLLLSLNALLLAATASVPHPPAKVVLFFVVGDLGWVALTAFCLLFGLWIEGAAAVTASVLVAAGVGVLGLAQYRLGVAGNVRAAAAD